VTTRSAAVNRMRHEVVLSCIVEQLFYIDCVLVIMMIVTGVTETCWWGTIICY